MQILRKYLFEQPAGRFYKTFVESPDALASQAYLSVPVRARLDCLTKPSDISHLTKF